MEGGNPRPIHAINELSMSGVVEITKSGRMENLLGTVTATMQIPPPFLLKLS